MELLATALIISAGRGEYRVSDKIQPRKISKFMSLYPPYDAERREWETCDFIIENAVTIVLDDVSHLEGKTIEGVILTKGLVRFIKTHNEWIYGIDEGGKHSPSFSYHCMKLIEEWYNEEIETNKQRLINSILERKTCKDVKNIINDYIN